MDPADVPDTRWALYPASINATTAPTRPMPLTPPPDSTRSAGFGFGFGFGSGTAPTLHGVERRDQPGTVDLLHADLHRARGERAVGILLADGVLVDEHQDLRGVRMQVGHRGPDDGGGGLDRLLLGRRCDDPLGELRVVREEVAGQMRLRRRE